jgi:hypothetical protein
MMNDKQPQRNLFYSEMTPTIHQIFPRNHMPGMGGRDQIIDGEWNGRKSFAERLHRTLSRIGEGCEARKRSGESTPSESKVTRGQSDEYPLKMKLL